ncbi:MAG: hypothetical protein V1663_02090 [archaeon]
MTDYTGQFIGNIKNIPVLKQLYQVCDWSFNKTMDAVGWFNPAWEIYLRENQGLVAFSLGFAASYTTVRLVENIPKIIFEKIDREDLSERYLSLLKKAEITGIYINLVGIPLAIEYFNPGGIQGLLHNHPVFSAGLIGLEAGSSLAASQEIIGRHKGKIKRLEDRILKPEDLD